MNILKVDITYVKCHYMPRIEWALHPDRVFVGSNTK